MLMEDVMKTDGSYLKLYLLPEEMVEIINEDLRSSLHHLLDKGTDIEEVTTLIQERLNGYYKDGWVFNKENL